MSLFNSSDGYSSTQGPQKSFQKMRFSTKLADTLNHKNTIKNIKHLIQFNNSSRTFPSYQDYPDILNNPRGTVTTKKTLSHPQTYWEGLVSGSLSGIVYTLVNFPFDTLKVRIQMANQQPFIKVLKQLKIQGRKAIFSGLSFPLLTVTLINSIVYASYEGIKKMKNSYNCLTFWGGCQAGAFAGFVSSWLTGPVQLIKCRMQNNPRKYKSSVDCLRQIIRVQGLRGLFVGMFATQMRDIAFFMGQFSLYEHFKQQAASLGVLSPFTMLMIGGLTGISSWIISYPQDIIKTKIQVQQRYRRHWLIPDGGFIQCGKSVYRQKGIRGFTRGLGSSLLGNVVSNATSILVYDIVGSHLNSRLEQE